MPLAGGLLLLISAVSLLGRLITHNRGCDCYRSMSGLSRFNLDSYGNGMPGDHSSQLKIIKDGQLVARKNIRLNDPLNVGDITIYQPPFGDAGSRVTLSITAISFLGVNLFLSGFHSYEAAQ